MHGRLLSGALIAAALALPAAAWSPPYVEPIVLNLSPQEWLDAVRGRTVTLERAVDGLRIDLSFAAQGTRTTALMPDGTCDGGTWRIVGLRVCTDWDRSGTYCDAPIELSGDNVIGPGDRVYSYDVAGNPIDTWSIVAIRPLSATCRPGAQ